MSNRPHDAGVLLLVGSAALAIPDLSAREGLVSAALALGLAAAALAGGRREAGRVARLLFLAGTLFLAVQPFAVPAELPGGLPVRALAMLGLSLALGLHLMVRSASGRVRFSLSPGDAGVLVASGTVVLASLGLLLARAGSRAVVPALLLQGMAVTFGVVYLHVSRWRPGGASYRLLGLLLATVLGSGGAAAIAAGAKLGRDWSEARAAWSARPPESDEVEAFVGRARRSAPERTAEFLAAAGRAALAHGRPREARAWVETAMDQGGGLLPAAAELELAEVEGDVRAAEAARFAWREACAGKTPRPGPFEPVTPFLARAVASDLLDAGQPEEALAWVEAAAAPGSRFDLDLLRGEALLALDRPAEAEAIAQRLAAAQPESPEPALVAARARAAANDPAGALEWLGRALAAGAPPPLVEPLRAAWLAAAGRATEASVARRALAGGIEVVARFGWHARHPNNNFLYTSREERRIPLLLAPGEAYRLAIEARAEPGGSEPPRLRVEAAGEEIADREVSGAGWEEIEIPLRPRRSAVTVRLTFPNDFSVPGGDDRNLVVGAVRLRLGGG